MPTARRADGATLEAESLGVSHQQTTWRFELRDAGGELLGVLDRRGLDAEVRSLVFEGDVAVVTWSETVFDLYPCEERLLLRTKPALAWEAE